MKNIIENLQRKRKDKQGFKSAARFVNRLTQKSFEKRGFSQFKLITNWAIDNHIDYIWAISKSEEFKTIFPNLYKRPLRFASWSNDSSVFGILKKGFLDLQGIDSDIESAFYIE